MLYIVVYNSDMHDLKIIYFKTHQQFISRKCICQMQAALFSHGCQLYISDCVLVFFVSKSVKAISIMTYKYNITNKI